MVELDSYSSVDLSDGDVNRDKAQALTSNSAPAKTSARLAAGFVIDMMRATRRGPYSKIARSTCLCEIP
jgi:hypothetical protein